MFQNSLVTTSQIEVKFAKEFWSSEIEGMLAILQFRNVRLPLCYAEA